MQRLVAMLRNADMAAIDAVEALGPLMPADAEAAYAELHAAVMALDFEGAQARCQALLA
jgi:hypothetical protein